MIGHEYEPPPQSRVFLRRHGPAAARQGRDHRSVRRPGAHLHLPAARRAHGPRRARCWRGSACARASASPCWSATGSSSSSSSSARCAPAPSRCRSTRGSRPTRSRHHRTPPACWRSSIPSCNRDALAIAARVPVRHRMLLDQQKDGFLAFEDRDGEARAGGRAAADRRRRAGVPALHLRLDRPPQGRDHDAPRHAVVRRLQPALLAVGRKRRAASWRCRCSTRTRCAAR